MELNHITPEIIRKFLQNIMVFVLLSNIMNNPIDTGLSIGTKPSTPIINHAMILQCKMARRWVAIDINTLHGLWLITHRILLWASKLIISSPLEAHQTNTIIFYMCGVDVGFDNPMFACW
eukprot:624891_1